MKNSDVAFSPAVKAIQSARGSRGVYARTDFESEVTDELVAFLAIVDTAFLASANAEGQPYVQHRGGPRGFIRRVDARTIGLPDFKGNRQYVTTGNLDDNDRVCLIAIDYATRRRVKIWGRARIVETPERALLITVSAWDVNCPKHIPQKIDAGEVEILVEGLRARIAELEAEIARR